MPALLQSVPDAWGPKFGLKGAAVTRTRTGPNEIKLQPAAHLALVLLTPQPDREVALGSDRRVMATTQVGAFELVPADVDLFARWTVDKENLLLAITHDHLAQVAGLEFGNESFELRPPKIGFVDRKALVLANMMREEFELGPAANTLCFDSLMTLFAVHLLRTYSSCGEAGALARGGLTPRTWRLVADHIDAHLSQPLPVAELAQVAGLSPSHFLRAFHKTCGQAPHQYIVGARLALAERLIRQSDEPVALIATAAGFSSNSHMTATMKRLRGMTPSRLRRDTRSEG